MRGQGKNAPIRRVVILGGGSAGWMCAAGLSRALPRDMDITLIESQDIGTVGVGEATIPTLLTFNAFLGLNEATFLRETGGTFKLGIEFTNWGRPGQRYFHSFGYHGRDTDEFKFHQLWLRLKHDPLTAAAAGTLDDYNLTTAAAYEGRFSPPQGGTGSILSSMRYAYHFDAALYGRYLRTYAEARGVRRVEGLVGDAILDAGNGFIQSLHLKDGRVIDGDLFIDCSGFRALLIGEALQGSFTDWSHWLPCDRAIAAPSHSTDLSRPYTRSIAEQAGWRWQIPLQHRMGNGRVYSSAFLDDDTAEAGLRECLGEDMAGEPRRIQFRTGHRQQVWIRNCIALGLSAGFIEPLESTSIHLVQMGLHRLLEFWPDQGFSPANIAAYNAATGREYAHLRDFIVMHYKLNQEAEGAFWQACREMQIPDSLTERLELFRANGRIVNVYQDELFATDSWLAVALGQGLWPDGYDHLTDGIDRSQLLRNMQALREAVKGTVAQLPTQAHYLHRYGGMRNERQEVPVGPEKA